jgi:hypothetical protein
VITPRHAYYYSLRIASRGAVAESINQKIRRSANPLPWAGLTFRSINKDAIDQARIEWPKHYSDFTHNGFAESWEKLYYRFAQNPAHFDLAIWQHIGDLDLLQGLAMGRPSDGKTHLTINWVERSFAPTYLRGGILILILACAEEYAKLLGCKRVLIKNPVTLISITDTAIIPTSCTAYQWHTCVRSYEMATPAS